MHNLLYTGHWYNNGLYTTMTCMLLDHLYTEPLTLVRKAPKILAFHYRPMASFDYETEYTQA